MRRLRDVRASILRARFSLSAVSSSIELLAVLASTAPSFFSRSMTSWLERFRSLASWKTLTFPIRLPSVIRDRHRFGRGCVCFRLRRRLRTVVRLRRVRRSLGLLCLSLLFRELGLGQAAILFRLLEGEPLRLGLLGRHPRRF